MEKNENVVDGRIISQTRSQIIYFKSNAQKGASLIDSVSASINKLKADFNTAERKEL